VGGCGHFPQWAQPVASLAVTDHGPGEGGRGVDSQAVLGELGDGPELFAAVHRLPASFPDVDDALPVLFVDQPIEVADETVEIGALDECRQRAHDAANALLEKPSNRVVGDFEAMAPRSTP